MSNIHIVGERLCRLKFLAFNSGKLLASERAAIHVVFIVLERLALGDLDGAFIVASLDEVGAVCPSKGDVSVLAVDAVAVAASGRDNAAVYRDSVRTVDAIVCASGCDAAAAYRDIAKIIVDALEASGRDDAAAYRDIAFPAVDAGTAFASSRDDAAVYRDIAKIIVDAVAVSCGRDDAAVYRDSFRTVDAAAKARGRDTAAVYRDSSLTVDAENARTICGVVQNSALPVLPVNGQIFISQNSVGFTFNHHLRTVREDEMSVTAKLDLVRVFHLALHHVPAASEVAHVG